MRRGTLVGALLILASCGDERTAEGGAAAPADGSAVTTAQDGSDTPDVKAQQASAETMIDCRTVKGQTAPAGMQADDILGVRPGMTAQEVRAVLTCKNPNYIIEERTQPISLDDAGKASEVTLTADTGLDAISVSLIGTSGQEKVVHIARTLEYVEGSELPVQAIEQELQNKYGSFDENGSGRRSEGYIIHARGGQRIGTSNSLYGRCRLQPDSHGSWQSIDSTKCGDVIRYRIEPSRENENLAFRFSVGVTSFGNASRTLAASGQAAEQEKAVIMERAKQTAAEQKLDL